MLCCNNEKFLAIHRNIESINPSHIFHPWMEHVLTDHKQQMEDASSIYLDGTANEFDRNLLR